MADISGMLLGGAVWLLAGGQVADAVPVPWTIELPPFQGAVVDPSCRNTPALARTSHCVGLPLQSVGAYLRAITAAGWVQIAATNEMTIYERPVEGRLCDLFILQAAGDNQPAAAGSRRALVWFTQHERQDCVAGQ